MTQSMVLSHQVTAVNWNLFVATSLHKKTAEEPARLNLAVLQERAENERRVGGSSGPSTVVLSLPNAGTF